MEKLSKMGTFLEHWKNVVDLRTIFKNYSKEKIQSKNNSKSEPIMMTYSHKRRVPSRCYSPSEGSYSSKSSQMKRRRISKQLENQKTIKETILKRIPLQNRKKMSLLFLVEKRNNLPAILLSLQTLPDFHVHSLFTLFTCHTFLMIMSCQTHLNCCCCCPVCCFN